MTRIPVDVAPVYPREQAPVIRQRGEMETPRVVT